MERIVGLTIAVIVGVVILGSVGWPLNLIGLVVLVAAAYVALTGYRTRA